LLQGCGQALVLRCGIGGRQDTTLRLPLDGAGVIRPGSSPTFALIAFQKSAPETNTTPASSGAINQ